MLSTVNKSSSESPIIFYKEMVNEPQESAGEFNWMCLIKNFDFINFGWLNEYNKANIQIDQIENLLFIEKKHNISIPSEISYVQKVCNMPDVEAIVYEKISGFKYITTILNKRDIVTSEKIYEVEMEISELYPNEQFYFNVDWLHETYDINSAIKGKKVIFHKRIIYAG
ncbi:Uncharacterized protein dnl_17810 [Desulfonema limicola]|uniref:Uncharacterized protein n=1 Tax=Desulfonema limicola TaxID=45656 RepID=A0A975B635_9BACT|nr:hypothetical protein [Desulfonema limicola]QTA79510.1 Uncharacterized protein dnl_17810 [Desulfonema limicola]